jgi:hypothetical protein
MELPVPANVWFDPWYKPEAGRMTVRPDGSGYTQPTKKISFTATAQQPKPKSATRSDSKPSGLSDEDKLRIRIATLDRLKLSVGGHIFFQRSVWQVRPMRLHANRHFHFLRHRWLEHQFLKLLFYSRPKRDCFTEQERQVFIALSPFVPRNEHGSRNGDKIMHRVCSHWSHGPLGQRASAPRPEFRGSL